MAQEVADSRTDRVAGGVLHTSAAAGWDGSALACLEDTAFSFPSIQMWLESVKPPNCPVFPKNPALWCPGTGGFCCLTHTTQHHEPPRIAGLLPDFSVCKSKRCCD